MREEPLQREETDGLPSRGVEEEIRQAVSAYVKGSGGFKMLGGDDIRGILRRFPDTPRDKVLKIVFDVMGAVNKIG